MRRMRLHECRDCLWVGCHRSFTHDLSSPIDNADRRQLQRHVQSDKVLHCGPPWLARPHEVGLVGSWRADSQCLDVARSRNYPMCENVGALRRCRMTFSHPSRWASSRELRAAVAADLHPKEVQLALRFLRFCCVATFFASCYHLPTELTARRSRSKRF